MSMCRYKAWDTMVDRTVQALEDLCTVYGTFKLFIVKYTKNEDDCRKLFVTPKVGKGLPHYVVCEESRIVHFNVPIVCVHDMKSKQDIIDDLIACTLGKKNKIDIE